MKNFDPTSDSAYVVQVENEKPRSLVVLQEVIDINASDSRNVFRLGKMYNEIVDNDYLKEDHCGSLKEFLMKRGIELSERELQYRMKIDRVAAKLGISEATLMKAKITKCKTIFKLNPDTVFTHDSGVQESVGEIIKQLVSSAPDMSAERVKEEVDHYLGKSKDEDEVIVEKIPFNAQE